MEELWVVVGLESRVEDEFSIATSARAAILNYQKLSASRFTLLREIASP